MSPLHIDKVTKKHENCIFATTAQDNHMRPTAFQPSHKTDEIKNIGHDPWRVQHPLNPHTPPFTHPPCISMEKFSNIIFCSVTQQILLPLGVFPFALEPMVPLKCWTEWKCRDITGECRKKIYLAHRVGYFLALLECIWNDMSEFRLVVDMEC